MPADRVWRIGGGARGSSADRVHDRRANLYNDPDDVGKPSSPNDFDDHAGTSAAASTTGDTEAETEAAGRHHDKGAAAPATAGEQL